MKLFCLSFAKFSGFGKSINRYSREKLRALKNSFLSYLSIEMAYPNPVEVLKKVWGVGAPRGSRLLSWGIAIGAFCVWQYNENKKFSEKSLEEWNKKAIERAKEKK